MSAGAGTSKTLDVEEENESPEFWVGHGNHLAQTEFLLHNIQQNIPFSGRFQKRCREGGVNGWFSCKADTNVVFGVMEGLVQDILRVRDWAECYIAQPFEQRTVLTTFTLCTQPEFTTFSQRK
ncbi:uncharacterized protein LOC111066738 [Drosophila obscura]|uniref:uncharacterized protein LOC111066738 n=1 Tax=Drosophila obscura TaxID=7282 RepID=UPI001BB1BF3C|nr:uncharacterized protein LOC111066738 [Drosophila obscura]XP_041449399.1 uncharacterized protein LOC111066738 [Drosophila obscura]